MRRPRASLLTGPTRYAGVSQATARTVLTILIALIVAATIAIAAPTPVPVAEAPPAAQTDSVLYDTIVAGVRHGGRYYDVAADAMRGGDYPLRPFVTMRLPTLTVVAGHVPPALLLALLWAIVAATALTWYACVAPALARMPTRVAAMLLLLAGMAAALQSDLVVFHEIWAGTLVAFSLGLRRPGRWIEAVSVGLAAALIRETAGLFLVLMAVFAWRDGQRREAMGWALAIGTLAVVLAAHAYAVAQVVRPLDPVSPGWRGLLGIGFVARSLAQSTALAILPLGFAAPIVVLALFGWTAWRQGDGRVVATLTAYALLLGIAARADNLYWALLIAPLWLLGLVFAIDGLRDLIRAALDSRRITVRRVVR